jgi:hypothetical protein
MSAPRLGRPSCSVHRTNSTRACRRLARAIAGLRRGNSGSIPSSADMYALRMGYDETQYAGSVTVLHRQAKISVTLFSSRKLSEANNHHAPTFTPPPPIRASHPHHRGLANHCFAELRILLVWCWSGKVTKGRLTTYATLMATIN